MNPAEEEIDARFRQTTIFDKSPVISNVIFDLDSIRTDGLGSDNWVVTWADDDHQYVSWGDGVGFGAADMKEQSGPDRAGFGFGRIEGGFPDFTVHNVSGGKNPEHPIDPAFDGTGFGNAKGNGKCYGLLAVDGRIYAWRIGDGHPRHMAFSELYVSSDYCATWHFTGVRFAAEKFANRRGFFAPTFCNYGRDYAGSRDDYIYIYAPEISVDEGWEVQIPGRMSLMRVLRSDLENQDAYEYFAGMADQPTWSGDLEERQPAFEDRGRGLMRSSISYNAGLGRYLLMSQQVSRWDIRNGHIGIYDAPNPWGPWTEVLCQNAWDLGLQHGYKNVFYNFSNKWLSNDGRDFVMIYTGPSHDQFGAVSGHFEVV